MIPHEINLDHYQTKSPKPITDVQYLGRPGPRASVGVMILVCNLNATTKVLQQTKNHKKRNLANYMCKKYTPSNKNKLRELDINMTIYQ